MRFALLESREDLGDGPQLALGGHLGLVAFDAERRLVGLQEFEDRLDAVQGEAPRRRGLRAGRGAGQAYWIALVGAAVLLQGRASRAGLAVGGLAEQPVVGVDLGADRGEAGVLQILQPLTGEVSGVDLVLVYIRSESDSNRNE